jgi:hypothetical protein
MDRMGRWRAVKAGTFPAPIRISPNRIAWYEHEVLDWLAACPRCIYGALAPEVMAMVPPQLRRRTRKPAPSMQPPNAG